MLSTIFCAVPAFIRVEPASTSGPTTGTIATSAARVISESGTQVTATVPNVSGTVAVTLLVGGVASNAANFTVSTTQVPNYSLGAAPASLTINRAAGGSVSVSITRSGGFTGSVALSASGLPAGVTASFSPASTTGNTSTLTLTVSSTATLGNATVTIGGSNSTVGARSVQVALTVGSGGGGGATISGAVASNSPWFIEEQVRLANPAPITAMTITITVARNPAGLSVSGQYNTLGSIVTQSSNATASQLTYTWTLAAGQTIPAGTGRVFAAQVGGTGATHPTTGDTWSVTYTSGGSTTTTSGAF